MVLPKLQYITHPNEQFDDLKWVHRLKEGGCNWIQLRLKEEVYYETNPTGHFQLYLNDVADRMRLITSALGMCLTINDFHTVAKFTNADGCHLGIKDIPKEHSLDLINFEGIIGGSVNSIVDFQSYNGVNLTYVGAGPLRKTETKSDTKEVLGIDGYSNLLNEMVKMNINLPVYAIGNVRSSDVQSLKEIGMYGIAVSSEIFNQAHSIESIQSFTRLLS